MTLRIRTLRLDQAENTLGGGNPAPSLTWTIETGEPGWRQEEAEIVAERDGGEQRIRLRTSDQVAVA